MEQASACSTKSAGELSANVDFCHVGSGFRLVGTISGTGLCVIDGLMEGTLNADMVKINPSATVIGEINCTRLDAAGGVQGEIKTGEVLLRSSAVINGSLSYKTIVIEKGAKIDGDIKYESSSVDHEIEHDGLESTADGLESTADGLESTADGLESTADGLESTADGLESTADGLESTADGLESTADGLESTADGLESTADGLESTADGLESTADGLESTADGLESTNLYEVQFPEDLRLLIAGASEVKLMLKGETEESSNILALSPLGVYVNRLKFEKHIRSGGANVCQLIVDDKWFDLLIP